MWWQWAPRAGRAAMLAMFVAMGLSAPHAARAQNLVLYGQVRGESDNRPIAGAMVVAEVERTGAHRTTSVTNADGRFALAVGDSAGIRVRILRLGHRPYTVGPVGRLFPGPATIVIPNLTITLAAIRVEGRSNCVSTPEEGSTLATVLNEIDKALELSTRRGNTTSYRVTIRQRIDETMFRSGSARTVSDRITNGNSATPFVSAPIEELLRDGYVFEDGQDMIFRSPDALVLLAPEFRNTHCFGVVEGQGDNAEMIGVTFTPGRNRGKHVDVAGTMWVERATSRLQRVEFSYDGLPATHRHRDVGGSFSLGYLPDGLVYVSDWAIRMPLVEEQRPFNVADRMRDASYTRKVAGLRVERGQVISMSTGGRVVYQAEMDSASRARVAAATATAASPSDRSETSLIGTATQCPNVGPGLSGDTLTVLNGKLVDLPAGEMGVYTVTAAWKESYRATVVEDWAFRDVSRSITVRTPTFHICDIPTDRDISITVLRNGRPLGTGKVNAAARTPSVFVELTVFGR